MPRSWLLLAVVISSCTDNPPNSFCAIDEVPCDDGCCLLCAVDQDCDPGLGCCDDHCQSTCARCSPEQNRCDDQSCHALASELDNCGACGEACGDDADTCWAGWCICGDLLGSCPTPLTCCGGHCVDTTSSHAHCAGCVSPCTAGQTCVSGDCTTGTTCNGATACTVDTGTECVVLATAPSHCGACNEDCLETWGARVDSCVGGSCVCAAASTLCGALEVCTSSGCVEVACDSSTCALGCCLDGACTLPSGGACGVAGDACVACEGEPLENLCDALGECVCTGGEHMGATECGSGDGLLLRTCVDGSWADSATCIDLTPPTVGVDDTSLAWRTTNPTLTLSVVDSLSAIDFAHVWWDSAAPTDFANTDTITMPSDGVHELHLQARDVAGNTSDILTVTYRLCSAGGWYVSAGDECVQAEAGYYSPAGDLARYTCPPNHSSSAGATSCTLTCLDTPAAFTYTGAAVDWVVPDDCDLIEIKVWGAGGGRADWGGSGGFSTATFAVTPGETLSVRVGGRSRVFGGGAGSAGSNASRRGGNGGDYSGVFRDDTPMIIAGGGGGGPVSPHVSASRCGAGGGIAGGDTGGITGGTQTEGGVGAYGNTAGSSLTGGDADYGTTGATYGGGGGGGGYFGGGAGHTGDSWGTGGAAGSGYAPAGGTTLQGVDTEPPMTTDPDYADGAGAPDFDGRIVIRRGS